MNGLIVAGVAGIAGVAGVVGLSGAVSGGGGADAAATAAPALTSAAPESMSRRLELIRRAERAADAALAVSMPAASGGSRSSGAVAVYQGQVTRYAVAAVSRGEGAEPGDRGRDGGDDHGGRGYEEDD